jgi:hypothetical protein
MKERELNGFRRQLDQLKPGDLARRLEEAYWRHVSFPFDQNEAARFALAGTLAGNSKRLTAMLEAKIAGIESEIATAGAEAAELAKELEVADDGAE